jgi:linoleoyl-CoA desaturase
MPPVAMNGEIVTVLFSRRCALSDLHGSSPTMTSAPALPASPEKHSTGQKVKFSGTDAFQKSLKDRIDRYFRMTKRSPRDCPQMYLKTGVVLTWFIASYVLLVFFAPTWWIALPLAACLGLSIAAIGFNIQHDGGHRAYSDRPWVNRLMGATLDLVGGSSYVWDHKHNTVHHTYANITGHDDDIEVGFLARMSPHQRRHKFHRFQHWYLWLLYGFLPIKWQLFDDYYNIARRKIGNYTFARPKGKHLAIFIAGKITFMTIAFVIPALFHPLWIVLVFYAFANWVNGILLATVFQLAHVVEDADFPMPDEQSGKMATHWAIHQVQTTVDFARNNRFLCWFLGGLNFQIEHHLFPRICHIHYPKLSRLVEKACREFGIQYNAHRTFWSGVASHFRWLREMGKPV